LFCLGSGIGSVVCDGVKKAVAAAAMTTAATATTMSRRSLSIVYTSNHRRIITYAAWANVNV